MITIVKVLSIVLIYILGFSLSFAITIFVIGSMTHWGASRSFCLGTFLITFIPIFVLTTFLAILIWRYKRPDHRAE